MWLRWISAYVVILVACGIARSAASPASFRDDFRTGFSPQWQTTDLSTLTVEQVGGHGVLRAGLSAGKELPHLYVVQAPGQWQDFVLEVEMRRLIGDWGGVRFRGRYDLFVEKNGRLLLRRDYQIVDQVEPALATDA